jgi:hypothetical protein
MEQAKYIPGVCNIGPQERVLRSRGGWIGTVAFMALAVYFHFAGFPKWVNYFLFIPALMGAIGLLQFYSHFCVNFGLRGLMNVDKEAFKAEPVERAEFRALDRKNAWRIISIGFGIALAATLLAYFL